MQSFLIELEVKENKTLSKEDLVDIIFKSLENKCSKLNISILTDENIESIKEALPEEECCWIFLEDFHSSNDKLISLEDVECGLTKITFSSKIKRKMKNLLKKMGFHVEEN